MSIEVVYILWSTIPLVLANISNKSVEFHILCSPFSIIEEIDMSSPIAALPKGSLILVTGATGYIASQIIKNLLQRGYRVRGTVRDLNKASWLNNELFPSYATSGDLELAQVPNIAVSGAFDEAVKGAVGVIHVATIATWSPIPDEVIPPTVQAAVNALESALKEASVKRFVYTSSVVAQGLVLPDTELHIDSNSWNDKVAQYAYAPPPYEANRGSAVYGQSKVEAERAVWKFVEDKQPSFTVNVVNPNLVLGEVLNKRQWSITPGWIKSLWEGNPPENKKNGACE
jgi:nucleoside-diphosphate-sugar epimerase